MNTPEVLAQKLGQYEDAESAIAVYKEAASYVEQYRSVQQSALDCARAACEVAGVNHARTQVGSCGWTQPKQPVLDGDAWAAALANDENLQNLVMQSRLADERLATARLPFMKLPAGRFYIR